MVTALPRRSTIVVIVVLAAVASLWPGVPAVADPTATEVATVEHHGVIVSFTVDASPFGRLMALDAAGLVAPGVPFASGNGFAADLDAAQIASLRRHPGVAAVTPNRVLEIAAANHDQTGASTAWAAGLRGEGQMIVVVDTGVDAANPNLAGKVALEACFTPSRGSGGDCPDGTAAQAGAGAAAACTGRADCSHGTHVASTAVAAGPDVVGTAPGASLAAVQVFSSVKAAEDRVVTDEASLVRALEWVDAIRLSQPVAAVNLSLGGDPVGTPCDASPALVRAIDRLAGAGIAVVASAGNGASTSMLSFPACLPNVVSVGAMARSNASAAFSNTSNALSLFAPGESIDGAWSAPCCTRTLSGTSFAAPQVTAAFALLRQQRGPGSVVERLALLRRTGAPVYSSNEGRWSPTTALRLDRALDGQYQSSTPAPLGLARPPIGFVDEVAAGPDRAVVRGWAIDPDTVQPVTIHVYVDNRLAATTIADRSRPDVGAAYPGYGSAHGYATTVLLARGAHTVCVYALELGAGPGNVLQQCRVVRIGDGIGALDSALAALGSLDASGWAIDTGRAGPTDVELLVDGVPVTRLAADADRPDVEASYPAYGAAHGFSARVAIAPGEHQVCARTPAANAVVVGCRWVTVRAGAPFGFVDVLQGEGGVVRVIGWAIDPDTGASIDVTISIDGRIARRVPAATARIDLATGMPGYGIAHGFQTAVAVAAGVHRVCLAALDSATDAPAELGCADVVV